MELLSGNEAIAQGAWEAGARIGVAYPGTPSTETMEAFGQKDEVYAEWCPNEKVAVEVGTGASAAGARVLATMKHVGVNVAADPLFTVAYTGVNGGFVILAADDPGMHSSQNEQDSRFYALASRIPILEPADSAEARAFTKMAFDLSERFDLPFLIRSTVRISHAKTPVETGPRKQVALKPYEKDPAKWVMMPAFAKPRRLSLDARIAVVQDWVESCACNTETMHDTSIGVICAGASSQYVADALPDASVLKLGMTWPVPADRIRGFAAKVDRLYVIDEASEYLSMQVRALGVQVAEPPRPLPKNGELTPGTIAQAFNLQLPDHKQAQADLPGRPPALCPGCPHRLVFKELASARCIVTGDIGCYTLGALPPLSAMDTTVDMGASISMAHGFELALAGTDHHPVVGIIGDSTFGHSGLSSLLNTAYNKGAGTICILDNRTTAMTGHQGNPFNGITLQHRPSREMDLEGLVRALGIEDVRTVDPNERDAVHAAIADATGSADDLSVIVFRSPCVLLRDSFKVHEPYTVGDECISCGVCASLGCPALSCDGSTPAVIDTEMCVGCGHCAQYCGFDAIRQLKEGQ
jgi:indolepyruvate ferredoxin oxidoreductase alpha subunit